MNYSRRQLYALGEPIGDSVTRLKPGGRVYGGGGGGSSTPSSTTQTADLPDWAKPYAKDAMAKGAALTDINQNPYQTYGGERIAGFTRMQKDAQQSAANMQPSQQLGIGSGLAGAAGMGAMNTNYQPGQFSMSQVQAPYLQNYQMQSPGNVYSPTTSAAQLGNAPQANAAQFNGPGAVGYDAVQGQRQYTPMMDTARTGYNPQLQTYQMQGPQNVQTQSFANPYSAQAYMSPYMQNVVGIQQREAQRAADVAKTGRNAQAVGAGAFGGSRQAIMDAEAERNLATQKGDIQAQGLQSAYGQAQGQFNAEQQARLQAQMANQQAGINVGGQNLSAALGVQQLGAQTGLQTSLANLSSAQQANVQNQAAQLQTQGLNAQQAMQAALANQQAGINTSQFNATNAYNTGLQNAQMRQQTGLANQALQGQYGLQQGQFQQAANAQNAQQGLQAGLANQTMGYNVGNQNLQSMLGVQQLGAGQNMQAQLANQQANQAAQQAAEQSRQYGAGLGMQGLQTALQSANTLGQFGQSQYAQEMGINQLQNQYGGQQQQQNQRPLDIAYQDFLNQQNYPYKQLGFQSDLIRGLPLGQKSTAQTYEAPGSLLGQLGGLGMGAYGLSKMGVFAEGGVTDSRNVESILSKLSDAQLQQAKQAALDRRDADEAQMIDAEIAKRASMRQNMPPDMKGIAPAISDEFANDMEQNMATGGIVAFADRGVVTEGDNYSHEGMRNPDSINMPKAKPKAGIPDAVKQAVPALAQQTGVPEEDLMARVPGLMDMFQKQYAPLIEQQRAMVEQSKPDTEAMKQQGLAQALTQFGFKMAANAARPNARFLESASAAAPEISTAVQDMNKLMSVKQDNYNKLKMDQMKYENALQIGNMKDATLLAGQIRQGQQADKQIKMQQDQLAATISHQTEMEAQGRRGLDIQSAQVAATTARQPETIKGLSEMLQNATPEQRKAIEDAARLRYGMSADIRADASLAARRATAVEKAQASMAGSLLAMTPRSDPKYAERKAAFDEQVQRELDQLPVDTRSGSAPATSAPSGGGTIMRFDSKGNPI